MRADIRANMEKEKNERLKASLKNKVMSGLLEHNAIIAPSAMVAEEVKNLRAQAAQRMGQDPESIDEAGFPDQLFNEEATRRVQFGLLISEIIKQEKNLEQIKHMVNRGIKESRLPKNISLEYLQQLPES